MKYEADIDLNKPFSYDDYDAYAPHTAIVTVYNDDGSVKDKREYGYKTIEEIQNELKKTNILELSHCYVKELKNIHGTIQSVHAFRTIFHNITEFNIKVTDEANFSHAVFIGKTTFSGTEFCGQVDFGNAIFMEYTSFWGSKFYGNTYFNYVTFYSDATFRDINSSKYIRFGNVVFHSTIEFSEASNSSTIEFNTVLFKGVSKLDFYSAHKFIFNSCMIEKTCDIRFDTHVDKLSISNCINIGYFSLPFNKMIKEAIYKFNSSDYIGGWIADIKADFTNAISILDNFWGYEFNRKRVNYRYKAEEFNFLKVNYNRIGEYEYEDAAYLEFRRCNENEWTIQALF